MTTGDACHIEFPTIHPEQPKTLFSTILGWTFEVFRGFESCRMF